MSRMARAAAGVVSLARHHRLAAAGAVVILVAAGVAAFATLIAPYGQLTLVGAPFGRPSAEHLLGLTDAGNDELSQLLIGTRVTMLVSLAAAAVSVVIGGTLGLIGGYFGGRIDGAVGRLVDYLLVMPVLPLAIVVAALWGPSLRNVILLIGLLSWPSTARLIRSQVKSIAQRVYVLRARAVGARAVGILARHVLPAAAPLLAAAAVISIGNAIFFEAALAFLGLSDPSTVTWGEMIANAFDRGAASAGAWWAVVPPGVAIGAVVLGATVFGRGVEDALNPRIHRSQLTRSRGFSVHPDAAPHRPDPSTTAGSRSSGDPAPLLEVRRLAVRFERHGGYLDAVRDVSFVLRPGERFGIVGESGCGKSTSLLATMGLLPPNAVVGGSVLLDGVDVLAGGEAGIRRYRWTSLAMVFQGAMNAFNPVRTIRAQVREPMLVHRTEPNRAAADTRARNLMDLVGLAPAKADAYPHQLSGGQRQRAALAMALACSPQVLLADEPTTALDVMVQARVLELLARLADDLGLAVVLVTHDLPIVAQFCDRAAVMYAGEIVEEATVDELLRAPAHPYTRALLGATPDLYANTTVRSIAGVPPSLDREVVGCPFAARCPEVLPECSSVPPPNVTLSSADHRARCHLVAKPATV